MKSDKSQYLLSSVYNIQFVWYKGKTKVVPGRQGGHSEKIYFNYDLKGIHLCKYLFLLLSFTSKTSSFHSPLSLTQYKEITKQKLANKLHCMATMGLLEVRYEWNSTLPKRKKWRCQTIGRVDFMALTWRLVFPFTAVVERLQSIHLGFRGG